MLVNTSSEFQDDGRLVTAALEALFNEPVQVIATVTSGKLPGGHIPSNARIETFVAHTPLLERAACAITHGGAGATQKALAADVPVCVVPFDGISSRSLVGRGPVPAPASLPHD